MITNILILFPGLISLMVILYQHRSPIRSSILRKREKYRQWFRTNFGVMHSGSFFVDSLDGISISGTSGVYSNWASSIYKSGTSISIDGASISVSNGDLLLTNASSRTVSVNDLINASATVSMLVQDISDLKVAVNKLKAEK